MTLTTRKFTCFALVLKKVIAIHIHKGIIKNYPISKLRDFNFHEDFIGSTGKAKIRYGKVVIQRNTEFTRIHFSLLSPMCARTFWTLLDKIFGSNFRSIVFFFFHYRKKAAQRIIKSCANVHTYPHVLVKIVDANSETWLNVTMNLNTLKNWKELAIKGERLFELKKSHNKSIKI